MTPIDQQMYQIFSDKTLSEGCKVYASREWYNSPQLYRNIHRNKYVLDDIWDFDLISKDEWDLEILWHPPQLHDVFRLAEERNMQWEIMLHRYSKTNYVLNFSKSNDTPLSSIDYNPTLPLLSQSDDTKSAIISLFK
jgi:hypothetical protein